MYFVFSKLGFMLREEPKCKKNTLLIYVLTWGSDPSERDGFVSAGFFSLDSSDFYYFFFKKK